jgi:hypothetical protein
MLSGRLRKVSASIVSQKYLDIILCATLPPAGRRSLRAAILLPGRFERPHNLNSHYRAGTEDAASRRVKSYGAARGDYEANGAVQMAPDQFDCGLEDYLPTGGGVAALFVKELLGRPVANCMP